MTAVNAVADSDRPTPEDRIRAALWFAERDFGVFSVWSTDPDGTCRCGKKAECEQPGKHPIPPRGFHDSTTDPDRIRTMLSAASQPNYGLLPPAGVFALDVDDDGDGIGRLARLEATYGPLPPTLRTQTANGQHIFLRWPDGLPRPLKKMFGYVTRWGSGQQAGYVIGPRSVHPSGFAYAPATGVFDIAVVPDRWAQAAVEGTGSEQKAIVAGPAALPARGGRHDWLRDRARYYRGVMDDPVVLRAALLAENARLEEPKTEEEVERAIGDVFEKFPADPPAEVEDRVSRRLNDDDLDLLGLPSSSEFPQPPEPAAFGGLLGELVADLADGTDASTVGLLGSLIAFTGALIPGAAYFARTQTSSPYIALVGESSIGRKGTAMNRVGDAFGQAVDVASVNRVILDGLSSGEGLISSLVYKREHFPQEPTVGLVFEEEYATLLAARGREGSTLDPRMRQAFDGGPLSNRKANETKTLIPPYWLSALIAITPNELRTRLEVGALQSGSANRWLYLPVVRRPVDPTNTLPVFRDELRYRLIEAHREAIKKPPLLAVEPGVTRTLSDYSDFLGKTAHGLALDLTKRFAIIAFRIALVHALVERSTVVATGHLHRGLALTEYARRGIPWVFGETIGDPNAAYLYRQLVESGRLTQNVITRHIIRDPIKRQAAIDELLRIGRARRVTIQTSGRSRHELVPVVDDRRPFVTFVHVSTTEAESARKNLDEMDESPELSTNGLGQKVDESWTKVGQKPPSNVTEGIRCHYYQDHQSAHKFVDNRWMCPICEGEGNDADR